jgi:hypothetical protein
VGHVEPAALDVEHGGQLATEVGQSRLRYGGIVERLVPPALNVLEAVVLGSGRAQLLDGLEEGGEAILLIAGGLGLGQEGGLAILVGLVAGLELSDLAQSDVLEGLGEDGLGGGHGGQKDRTTGDDLEDGVQGNRLGNSI